jgi:hypothetical protein
MKPIHVLAACGTLLGALSALPAPAQPALDAHARTFQAAEGGRAAHAGGTVNGSRLKASRQQGAAADGQGNLAAGKSGGFTTEAGGQGLRNRKFKRNADGSINASGQGAVTTANGGSAERSGSFTRDADGNASGERSTTATNANTGVTMDASTSYSKGSGVSRSTTCHDAAGNTVSCGAH